MSAQAIMKRGRRQVALFVKEECLRSSGVKPQLSTLLTYLLDPTAPLEDFEKIDWCRNILGGGMDFDRFAEKVRQYDNAEMCGLVWTADFVAYRCRTCGISPSMSLCSNCFLAANHKGHDFNMFKSQAGGACDCGDANVMKKEGFCSRHGPQQTDKPRAPPELLAVATTIMPRLLWRLIQHLRDNSPQEMQGSYINLIDEAEQYINFLQQLSDMGAAMREIITKAVTDSTIYNSYCSGSECVSQEFHDKSQADYKAALEGLQAPPVPVEFEDLEDLKAPLVHATMLDELIFWLVKFEFPQKLVTFLLELLPNDQYKSAFTHGFVKHYSRISVALVGSAVRGRISSRVVHISVQLLSPENLAREMVEKYHLLHIMLMCLRNMIESQLTTSGLHGCRHNTQLVVDCSREVLKEHCYWPIVSDFINILSHKSITINFLSNPKLLMFWFELLTYFQGMNMNQRELDQHVDFEPETYYAAFSAELEICASTMWSIVQHCTSPAEREQVENVVHIAMRVLQEWFDGMGIKPFSKPNPLHVSFHLPLHRHLAVFLDNAVKTKQCTLSVILPPADYLQMVMIHLLQIQVAYCEIFAGMWVRNGLQIKGQAMTYVQCHFCNSMLDADIYLLQVCASSLDPDYFLRTVLERFHVLDLLTFAPYDPQKKLGFLESDKQMPMLEGALSFLSILLGIKTKLGASEEWVQKIEMVNLLCTSDRTHSQITDSLPEKCGINSPTKDIESKLKEIADYKAPVFEAGGTMQQGTYVPKSCVWSEYFDPLYVLLRAMYKKDFQNAMDRFTEYARQSAGYTATTPPWPPFRLKDYSILPEYKQLHRLLHCRTMHAVLFTLLYKSVNDKMVTDAVVYFTIHLLRLALNIPNPSAGKKKISVSEARIDKYFSNWFSGDDINMNLRTAIPQVLVTVQTMSPVTTPRGSGAATHDSADEEDQNSLLQLAPSALSGGARSGGSRVVIPDGSSSEVINAVQALLEDTTNQVDGGASVSGIQTTHLHTGVRSLGVSANMETKWKNVKIDVGESMLSLLLKLHTKLSTASTESTEKTCTYIPVSERPPSSKHSYTGLVGDGVHFVGQTLDQICDRCEENRHFVRQIYRDSLPKHETETDTKGAKKKKISDLEERRRRAREKQKKVMADFANRQKSFMDKMKEEKLLDDVEDQEELMFSEQKYDCVICNQSAPSTDDNPIGLVLLAQATSLLGHRRYTDDALILPTSDDSPKPVLTTCATENKGNIDTLLRNFDESSVLMSLNIGWRGGVHTQTCGHYVHLECHKSYMKTVDIRSNVIAKKGEFMCPLCRQLSNTVVPVLPDVGPALTMPLPQSSEDMIVYIADNLGIQRPQTPAQSALMTAMGLTMEELTKSTESQFRTCGESHTTENVLLFVSSVLRCNLEAELVQRSGCACLNLMSLASKKSCILPVLHVLSMHCKILLMNPKPYSDTWYHIAGHNAKDSTSIVLQQKEVPVLLKDAICLLIQLVLLMPPTMDKEVYKHLVQALYNLVYTQALVKVSLKFSEEERSAWKAKVTKGQHINTECLEGILGLVISQLNSSGLYEDESVHDPHVPAICCSVWSPQSVECEVQQYCLSFLNVAALLQHHLYSEQLPQLTKQREAGEEFTVLCTHLGLTPSILSHDDSHLVLNSVSCMRWLNKECGSTVMEGWFTHLKQFIHKTPMPARTLLSANPTWRLPQLFKLPHQYDQIFQYYRRKQCETCKSLPKDPALCLVCGRILCFKERCCDQLKKSECSQHAVTCGGGLGIYLIVLSSFIVVLRGPRATIWGCVYLDQHGEEDRELKRGRPLYLCEERFKLLEQQWLTHSFDRACKRWVVHRDQL